MGRSVTESKLSDGVRFEFERFRHTEAGGSGLLDFRARISCGTETLTGEALFHYVFDLFGPEIGLTQVQIDDIKARMAIAVSKLATKLGVVDGTP